MSYIGRGIDQIDNISTLDNLSFSGSTATFNLTQNSVAFVPVSADALQIQIDGVIQSGNYTVSGSTVTFDFTPSSSSVCNGIKHFGVGLLSEPSDGSVTTAKLGADSVNGTKIADNSIDSEHYVDGSIDLAHLSSQSVDEDNLYISNAGSNGQFLSKSSNAGGLTWADAGGGVGKLIQTGSFPDSGDTINFSNVFNNASHSSGSTADYQQYILYFTNVYANGANKITVQFETGGDTYLTGSDYQRVNFGRDASGSTRTSEGSSADRINIQSTNANQSNWASRSGYIIFNKPSEVSARKTIHGQVSYFSNETNSPLTIEQFAGMHSQGSSAVTGFRLVASTSTFEGGNYYLYGLKGSI